MKPIPLLVVLVLASCSRSGQSAGVFVQTWPGQWAGQAQSARYGFIAPLDILIEEDGQGLIGTVLVDLDGLPLTFNPCTIERMGEDRISLSCPEATFPVQPGAPQLEMELTFGPPGAAQGFYTLEPDLDFGVADVGKIQ